MGKTIPMDQARPHKKFWKMEVSADGQSADAYILGEIVPSGYEWDESDTSAQSFLKDLQALGEIKTINLHINSPGGDVFSAAAIENMLKQHQASVHVFVDGLAASAASVIAMAGDKISIPENAMMMIHNPWSLAIGNASELRKQADDLDHIGMSMRQSYLSKAGDKLTEDKLVELLDNESWLSAQEAVDYGLADEVLEPQQAAASISSKWLTRYKHVPQNLVRTSRSEPAVPDARSNEPSLLSRKLKIIRS